MSTLAAVVGGFFNRPIPRQAEVVEFRQRLGRSDIQLLCAELCDQP